MTGNPFGWGTNLLATLTRPSSLTDPRVLGATDDFMQDCSSPTAQDGTQFSAEQANEVVANLRALLRANGFKADGVTKIIAEDHSDGMLAAALMQYVQRGRANFCVDSGAADALAFTPNPLPAEIIDGMTFRAKTAHANATTAPTLTIATSGGAFGPYPIKKRNGASPAIGDLVAGVEVSYRFDAATTAFVASGVMASDLALATWTKFYDHTFDGTATSDVVTIPSGAKALHGWVFSPGTSGSGSNCIGARVSFDGSTFLSTSGAYSYGILGTVSAGIASVNNMPLGIGFDNSTAGEAINEFRMFLGGASQVAASITEYRGFDQAGPGYDFGKMDARCGTNGLVRALQIIGDTWYGVATGGAILAGTRVIIEALS